MRRRFYDLKIGPLKEPGEAEKVFMLAEHMGYRGIAVVVERPERWVRDAASMYKLELYLRADIHAERLRDARRKAREASWADIVGVVCRKRNFAREAAKIRSADLLSFDGDSIGLIDTRQANVVMLHGKVVEIVLRGLIVRSKPLHQFIERLRKALEVGGRTNMPIAISSGAISHRELRGPRDLASIVAALGHPMDWALNMVSKVPESVLGGRHEA